MKPAAPAISGAPASGASGGGTAGAAPTGPAGALGRGQQLQQQQQQQAAANANATDQGAAGDLKAGASTNSGLAYSGGDSRYSLNPEAGIITVYANQRQQKAVERYLRDVRTSMTQQVLIEAKVLEITLNDNFRSGVDWNAILGPNSNRQNFSLSSNFGQNISSGLITPDLAATWTGAILSPNGRNNLSLAAQLVSQFGTVRTLSSPRLTVLNNQMAQRKVVDNQVFFELQVNITQGTATTAPLTTVNSQIKTVPVGLILSVQPAIDPITRHISLSLRPSITRITGFINDPGVAVSVAVAQQNNPNAKIPTVTSPIPIIEVREMDSMVNMESGQTLVMGGLMQESAKTGREGVPGLMDVPLIGQVASENTRENTTSELVIFIRTTLVNAPGTVSDEDIRLYRKFGPDPRPIAF
jgi:general secretion pathway protein D